MSIDPACAALRRIQASSPSALGSAPAPAPEQPKATRPDLALTAGCSAGRRDQEQQSRLNLNARLVSRAVYDGGPRDTRCASPKNQALEAGWDSGGPLWGNYIPEYGSARAHASVAQIEEYIKRPITVGSWRTRDERRKVPSTIFTNSLTHNRRHYEPNYVSAQPLLLSVWELTPARCWQRSAPWYEHDDPASQWFTPRSTGSLQVHNVGTTPAMPVRTAHAQPAGLCGSARQPLNDRPPCSRVFCAPSRVESY